MLPRGYISQYTSQWLYFTVYSLEAIFHRILATAITECSVQWEIDLSKRATLRKLIKNEPFFYFIFYNIEQVWLVGELAADICWQALITPTLLHWRGRLLIPTTQVTQVNLNKNKRLRKTFPMQLHRQVKRKKEKNTISKYYLNFKNPNMFRGMPMLALHSYAGILQATRKQFSAMGPTDTNTHTHMTNKHCNLETESAQWADSVKNAGE